MMLHGDEMLGEPASASPVNLAAQELASKLAPLRKGELVAERFLVEGLVGVGGMGAVYRAHDLLLAEPVALKVMARHHSMGIDRFAREAAVLAQLSHPAIVRYVMHGATAAGTPFLAMEWLEGEDLSVALTGKGLLVEDSLALVRRICTGLVHAHANAVVHRDIKPSNIFLVGGSPSNSKILDFGVARFASPRRSLTRAGSVLGTIGYMAPEQAMGSPGVDARADVFALGCVLFECLTGSAAFAAQHEVAVLAKVLRENPPRVSDVRPGLGSALDVFVARLLAKEPAQRPSDAAAVLRELGCLSELRGDAPTALNTQRARLSIDSEQRIITLVLAQPVRTSARTEPREHAEKDAAALDEICWAFRVDPVVLQRGDLLLFLRASTGATASDQAAQGARCALRLRALRPSLAIAVATGAADVTSRIPVGAAVDRAAALLADVRHAEGPIVVDALTAGLLGSRFDVQRVGERFSLIEEVEALEAPRLLMGRRTPCVGRDKELALLGATLEECVSDDVARVVFVTAPPGIGKSRLGHEFVEQVRAKGTAKVLVARAEPNVAGSALRVVRRLVRAAVGLHDSDPPSVQAQRLQEYLRLLLNESALERALEFLAELIGIPVEEPSALLRAARNDPEIMREQTRRVFELWVDCESSRRPLVLFLDDLHWADPPSVAYVEELLQVWSNRRILVLAVARPEVHERFPKLWQSANVQEVRLKGLTQRAAERLVNAILSQDQQPVARRIIALADGNAFYLEELIRSAAEGVTEFPETVLAMVQSRIDSLQSEERRVLRAGSVFGETFWAGAIDALIGGHDAASWLDGLVQREILVRRPQARFTNEREYGFRHAFLRDAAYMMLPRADQKAAHGMAGEWLENVGESDARLLAHHFERSTDPARAIPWLVRAALSAVEAGDIDGAKAVSADGLALGASGRERGLLLLVGEYMSAWSCQADRERLCEAADLLPQASAQWWLAVASLIFCASGAGEPEAAAPYLELAYNSPTGSELTGFRGLALQSIASGTILVGSTDIGWSLLERFEQLALDDVHCDPTFVTRLKLARSHLGTYSRMNGRWQLQKALDWARESTEAMDAAGSASGEMTALLILGCTWLFLGAYANAEATVRQSLQNAQRCGNLLVEHYSQLILAWIILRQGRLEEVASTLAPALDSRDANVLHGTSAVCAEAEYMAGRLSSALERGRAATQGPAAPYRRMAWTTTARAYLALDRAQEALDAVEAAYRDGNDAPNLEFEIDLRTTRACALRELGQPELAHDVLNEAKAFLVDAAASIEDSVLRHHFLYDVRAHRRLSEITTACPTTSLLS